MKRLKQAHRNKIVAESRFSMEQNERRLSLVEKFAQDSVIKRYKSITSFAAYIVVLMKEFSVERKTLFDRQSLVSASLFFYYNRSVTSKLKFS